MYKKVLCASIAAVMICGLLAGCQGSNNSAAPTQAPANTQTSSNTQSSTTTAAEPAASTELPYVTLTWYFPGTEPEERVMVEDKLEEFLKGQGLNCRMNLKFVDWGAWGDQTNVMISSQEAFDIMFTAGWDGFLSKVNRGAFLDITDMWDKYLPKTKAMLPQVYFDSTIVKGRSYGVSTNKDLAHAWGIVYNSDMANELGIDMSKVKSIADMSPVLEKVKSSYPDLIGIAMDRKDNTSTLLDWDPICAQEIPAKLYPNKDMVVVNEYATPETAALLNTVRALYLDGYIRSDAATLDDRRPDYEDGRAFCYTTTLKPFVEKNITDRTGQVWQQLAFTQPFITSNDATGSINCVSVTSKNPERSLMFLELMNTDQYMNNLVNFGIEGVHFERVGETERKYMEGQNRQTVKYHAGADWQLGNQFLNYINAADNTPDKWDRFRAFNAAGKPSIALGFVFDQDPVKTEISAVTNVKDQYCSSLFTGSVDPNEVLPQFLQALKDAGIDKIVEEAQRQLDAWAATR